MARPPLLDQGGERVRPISKSSCSVHHLTGDATPRPAIGRACDFDQACACTVRTTRWVRNHFDRIADFKHVFVHTLLRKLSCGRAFDGPPFRRAFGVLYLDEAERV